MKKILKRIKWGNLISLVMFTTMMLWLMGSITEVWYTAMFDSAHEYSNLNMFILLNFN